MRQHTFTHTGSTRTLAIHMQEIYERQRFLVDAHLLQRCRPSCCTCPTPWLQPVLCSIFNECHNDCNATHEIFIDVNGYEQSGQASPGPGPLQDRFSLLLLLAQLGVALAAAFTLMLIFEYHSYAAYQGSLNDLVLLLLW